ncbi:MAG: transcriptional repressor LexA [Oscillospiraceae bacterium]|nr:transcriptional repressor LexA [Oscillospiraceae bacterium]MBQ3880190.1 transcriptional repressor LexA [Oscillospiraceae bacterium]
MKENKISKKQLEILEYIQKTTKEKGFPPSVREIAAAVGLRSPSTVHAHLKVLDREGYIKRDSHKMRAISTNEEFESVSEEPLDGNLIRVPLIGRVTAGLPILAVEDVEGYIPFDATHSSGEHFALHVQGDSMIGAGILDGDVIIVRRQSTAQQRDIVVALIEDEATVKRFSNRNGHPWLMPENPAYEPIDGEGAQILGKVVFLMRNIDG